jgi:hypothetical protein
MAQNWLNKDGLFLQFGADKAISTVAGEYLTENDGSRIVDFNVDLTKLLPVASSAGIISNTLIWPASPTGTTQNMYVEQVDVITLVGMTVLSGATAINVGLTSTVDRTTVISATAFVNGMLNASFTTSGQKVSLTAGSTGAGGYIGTPGNNTVPAYLTVSSVGGAGTYSAGLIKVRIKYSMYGTITQ